MAATYYPYGPIEVRDATYERVADLGIFKTISKYRTKPLKSDKEHDQLPNATVWNLGEECESMVEENIGAPAFFHRLRLAIEITTVAGTDESLDTDITELVYAVQHALYNDPTWVNMTEGQESFKVDYACPHETQEILCRAIINIVVTYRSIWDPDTPFKFKSVAMATPQHEYDNPVFVQVEIKE